MQENILKMFSGRETQGTRRSVMIKKLFRKRFEQTQTTQLPPKASRILQGVASEYLASNRSAKHHEMAQANLHMKLYQQFGHGSSHIVSQADKVLHDLLGPKTAA